jgi:cobalamin-dependent methionine synthase I
MTRVGRVPFVRPILRYIDWTPFFQTWELKGIYPRIFEHELYGEQARSLYADAQMLLDKIIAEKLPQARAVYGIFPANAVGDDVEVYTEVSFDSCHATASGEDVLGSKQWCSSAASRVEQRY